MIWIKLGLVAAVLMSATLILREVHQSIYRRGWNDAIASIAAVDKAGAEIAKKAKNTVDDCWNNGGEWDVPTQSCLR